LCCAEDAPVVDFELLFGHADVCVEDCGVICYSTNQQDDSWN
jgi:hypothetical protein